MTSLGVMGTISKVVSFFELMLWVNGDVFQCMEVGVNIASPTIQTVDISSTIECMAACQASLLCQYWTLDIQNEVCQFKQTDEPKVSDITSVSGKNICQWCTEKKSYHCYGACDPYFEIPISQGGESCDDNTFTIYLNESGINQEESWEVWVNGFPVGTCQVMDHNQRSNKHFTCGEYSLPQDNDFFYVNVIGSETIGYEITYYDSSFLYDLFAPATICPNASEITRLANCNNVLCGEYCSANSTLPVPDTNYVINNCLIEGHDFNIFIRICNGEDKPTLQPTTQPSTVHPSTSQPTVHPSPQPTPYPSINVTTSGPTFHPTQGPTSGNGNWINLKFSKDILVPIIAVSGFLISLYLFRFRRARRIRKAVDYLLSEDQRLPHSGQFSSITSGKRYRIVEPLLLFKHYYIDDLVIGELVGSGSFSEVYLVTIKENLYLGNKGMDVAGKKIIHSNSESMAKDFRQEVNLLNLAANKCDFIVNLIGIVTRSNIILLEYYRNGSLDEALLQDYDNHGGNQGTKFPILLRLKFMLHLCHAVTHLQKHCIVHRDLASRNLLLSDDHDRVVLTDFGLARKIDLGRAVNSETCATEIQITNPPESYTDGKAQFSLKTDVWGVAMTIFEILNMRPIVRVLNQLVLIEGTRAMKPASLLLDDITIGKAFARLEELEKVTANCWSKNPEQRPQIWEVDDKLTEFCCSPVLDEKNTKYVQLDESRDERLNKEDCDYQFGGDSKCLHDGRSSMRNELITIIGESV